jgi:hypothetical protein
VEESDKRAAAKKLAEGAKTFTAANLPRRGDGGGTPGAATGSETPSGGPTIASARSATSEVLNYDVEAVQAPTVDGVEGGAMALTLYSRVPPPDLARRPLRDIAAFAGLPLSSLTHNPFVIMRDLSPDVVANLLAPVVGALH